MALIDTGAARSYVGLSVMKHCQEMNYKENQVNTSVRVADNHQIILEKEITVPIKIAENQYIFQMQYFPNLTEDVIFGVDILQSIGIKLFFDQNVQSKQRINNDGSSTLSTITDLSIHESKKLSNLLETYLKIFNNFNGPALVKPFSIKMKNEEPIKQRYFPRNPAMQEIINKEINLLLEENKIEPSTSPYHHHHRL